MNSKIAFVSAMLALAVAAADHQPAHAMPRAVKNNPQMCENSGYAWNALRSQCEGCEFGIMGTKPGTKSICGILAPCKIVVEEAGGRFTDFEGRPTIYSGTALVTNGHLHDATLALLRHS